MDGNQASKTDFVSKTTGYTYDGLGRLLIETGPSGVITSYTYDDYNNRATMAVTGGTDFIAVSYIYDKNNRLITETKTVNGVNEVAAYGYDNNGNQISKGSNTYAYDGLNRLIGAEENGKSITYTYNANDLRRSKSVNGISTVHIWDGQEMVAELDGSGTLTNRYIRGINLISSDNETGTNKTHFLYNGHGDVIQLTNASGSVIKSYDYDAFGNEKNPDANDTNVFRYCGEYFDKETGSVYLRARYYDPEIGRFISEDSARSNKIKLPNGIKIDDPLSLNLYTYCYNDPVNLTDPSGNTARSAWDGFVKGIDDNMLGGYIGQFGGWLRNITGKDPVDWEEYYKLDSDYKNGYDTGELLSYLSALGGSFKSMTSPQTVLVTPNGQVITGYSPFGPTINMADKNDRKFNVNKQESKQWNSLGKVKGQDRRTFGAGKDKKYFEWDFTHNDIEVYNSKGKHLGSMDPTTGDIYKPAVKGRTIKIN